MSAKTIRIAGVCLFASLFGTQLFCLQSAGQAQSQPLGNASSPLGDYVPCMVDKNVQQQLRTTPLSPKSTKPHRLDFNTSLQLYKYVYKSIFELKDDEYPEEYKNDLWAEIEPYIRPEKLVGIYPEEADTLMREQMRNAWGALEYKNYIKYLSKRSELPPLEINNRSNEALEAIQGALRKGSETFPSTEKITSANVGVLSQNVNSAINDLDKAKFPLSYKTSIRQSISTLLFGKALLNLAPSDAVNKITEAAKNVVTPKLYSEHLSELQASSTYTSELINKRAKNGPNLALDIYSSLSSALIAGQ